MSTETVKRCDIYDTKREVKTVRVLVEEVVSKQELSIGAQPADVLDGGKAIWRAVREIKTVTLDMGPKALERCLACVVKGTTPPGGKS